MPWNYKNRKKPKGVRINKNPTKPNGLKKFVVPFGARIKPDKESKVTNEKIKKDSDQ